MHNLFLLSIFEKYVRLIQSGQKTWEFRENPVFGKLDGYSLKTGDVIFIVATGVNPSIPCYAKVLEIRRGEDLISYFADPGSGRWMEAGFPAGTPEEEKYFYDTILANYKSGVRLKAYELPQPLMISEIIHRNTGKKWNGRGFLPVDNLKRFEIFGKDVKAYLSGLISD